MSVRMPVRKRWYKRKDGTRFFTWYFDKLYEGIGWCESRVILHALKHRLRKLLDS